MAAHGHNGSEALACEEIAADAGEQDGNGDDPLERRGDSFEHFLLCMQRLQYEQRIVPASGGKMPRESTIFAFVSFDLTEKTVGTRRAFEKFLKRRRRQKPGR